jgi:hypothetical protein
MYLGDNFCNCEPPDPIAAAGPNHVIEMVNSAIEIFNKNGTAASNPVSLATFFSSLSPAHQTDPFVMYAETTGNFVAGVVDYTSSNKPDNLDFAVSQGDPATGSLTWTFKKYNVGEGKYFGDYPRAGWNADAYFVSFNMYKGSFFNHAQTLTINKSTLAVASHHDYSSSFFTVTPAVMHGAVSGGPEYFVESSFNGGSTINVVTETNVLSSSPTFTTTAVSVTPYTLGGSPQQPGGTIPAFDSRIFNAAFRVVNGVGHLVAAHQGGHGSSTPVDAIWYDFVVKTSGSTTTVTVANQGFFNPNAASGASTFMPSVDINTAGAIGMVYCESSPTEYWSIYVTGRLASDAPNTMESPVRAVAGTATSSDSRVGDFSAITVDPSNGLTFWAANEYQGSNFWNTHIASFTVS